MNHLIKILEKTTQEGAVKKNEENQVVTKKVAFTGGISGLPEPTSPNDAARIQDVEDGGLPTPDIVMDARSIGVESAAGVLSALPLQCRGREIAAQVIGSVNVVGDEIQTRGGRVVWENVFPANYETGKNMTFLLEVEREISATGLGSNICNVGGIRLISGGSGDLYMALGSNSFRAGSLNIGDGVRVALGVSMYEGAINVFRIDSSGGQEASVTISLSGLGHDGKVKLADADWYNSYQHLNMKRLEIYHGPMTPRKLRASVKRLYEITK